MGRAAHLGTSLPFPTGVDLLNIKNFPFVADPMKISDFPEPPPDGEPAKFGTTVSEYGPWWLWATVALVGLLVVAKNK